MDNPKEYFTYLKEKLAEGNEEFVLDELSKIINSTTSYLKNDIILIKGRFSDLHSTIRHGIKNNAEITLNKNQLRKEVLELLDEFLDKIEKGNKANKPNLKKKGRIRRSSKKIAILGSHGVGKTSLINQFIYYKFPENYLTTIGLKVDKKTVKIDDHELDMVIWDVAGQENLDRIPLYYLNGCSGIIFVVDLTRPSTYGNINDQIKRISPLLEKDAVFLIAANKSDLLTKKKIKRIVSKILPKPDMITSAKNGHNVEDLFLMMARRIIIVESQEDK